MADETLVFKVEFKGAKEAEKDLGKGHDHLKKMPGEADKLTGALKGVGGAIAAMGLVSMLESGLELFKKQELAVTQMEGGLRSLGEYTPHLSEYYQFLASSFQRVSRLGDEELLPMMSKLNILGGLGADKMQRVMQAALDFSVVTGGLSTAIDLLAKSAVGYTSTLSRYGIILDESIPKSEKFEAVLEYIESRMGGLEQKLTETTDGAIKQMWNALGDLAETGFSPLAPLVSASAKAITEFAQSIDKVDYEKIESLVEMFPEFSGMALRHPMGKTKAPFFTEDDLKAIDNMQWLHAWKPLPKPGRPGMEALGGVMGGAPPPMPAGRPGLPGWAAIPGEAPGLFAMEGAMLESQEKQLEFLDILATAHQEKADLIADKWLMVGDTIGNAFAQWASGAESFAGAMKKAMLGTVGSMAMAKGQFWVLEGAAQLAALNPGGAVMIAKGLGLIALGGTLGGLSARTSGGGGGGSYPGGGGDSGGYRATREAGGPHTVIIIAEGRATKATGALAERAIDEAIADRNLAYRINRMQRTGEAFSLT